MNDRSLVMDRPLQGDEDAMRVRQLLIDSYAILGCEFNWETRRWEGTYWHTPPAERALPTWDPNIRLWETTGGLLVGAAIPDGPGDVALQVHPEYRYVEDAMLDWAEAHIAHTNDAGQRELHAWAFDWDTERQERLARRGHYLKPEWFWHRRRRAVSDPVPDLPLAAGYTLRSLHDSDDDAQRWVTCTNQTFGHSHSMEMMRVFQLYAPSHNYDLHIVAELPDGSFAAFAGLTVDSANRTATFEPVGTHSDHRRKGLARAAMFEGIRRLQALGTVDTVYVTNWGTADAGKLYASVGMAHYATETAWNKVF